ncbi:hypothetical protein E2C01_085433 [Portunus trituberculatus]|uniref:Uncharacterized protein n=1 Tax=Portunus trituberculatus TaxID=210409 RepID=A0A5B7J6T9_PORTR|nr:hypothetical protein [Portunus trituberculatus]
MLRPILTLSAKPMHRLILRRRFRLMLTAGLRLLAGISPSIPSRTTSTARVKCWERATRPLKTTQPPQSQPPRPPHLKHQTAAPWWMAPWLVLACSPLQAILTSTARDCTACGPSWEGRASVSVCCLRTLR